MPYGQDESFLRRSDEATELEGIYHVLERIAVALERRAKPESFPSPEEVCGRDESTSWDATFRTLLVSSWSPRQKEKGKEISIAGLETQVAERLVERLNACGWDASFCQAAGIDDRGCILFCVKPR